MREKPLILVVDDDTFLADVLDTKFTKAGFSVLKAYNGKECCEIAKKEKPDLIILDLRMPIMDGAEALAKLKSDPDTKDIKVFILSLFNEWAGIKLTKESAVKLGAVDFMEKSGDLDTLVQRVRSLLS